MTMHRRELYIPRLDLDLAGVDAETAEQIVALLPAALERALNPGHPTISRAFTGAAQALADTAATRFAAIIATQVAKRREGVA